MVPIRRADGYTLNGIKKYKRFFLIREKNNNNLENQYIEI
jgi:hypothetical protein